MHRSLRIALIMLITLALSPALSACSQETPAADEATEQVEEKTDARQAAADAVINGAQKVVDEAAEAAGDLEAKVDGLQIKSDLQQIQRELNRALESSGDERKEALRAAGDAVDAVISDIETAAANAPEGGELQASLNELAGNLRGVQTKLAAAIDSIGDAGSSETTP